MKFKNNVICLATCISILTFTGCSSKDDQAPAAPANSQAVTDFLKGKKLTVKQVGFFGSLVLNGAKDIEWLDVAKEKNETTKKAIEEEMGISLQFTNDTAVTIMKKEKSFTGTYAIVKKTEDLDEGEQPGIKLKVTFADPDFGFGDIPMNVTYTYPVLGLDAKRIMLETPRSINRQKLISMMSE